MTGAIQPMAADRAWFRRNDAPKPYRARKRQLRRAFADACYIALRLVGWASMTGLATLGVFVLFFLMLGDFTAIGFFSQIANLGTRFVAAGEVRRQAFTGQAHIAFYLALGFIALIRWPLLITSLASRRSPDRA